MGERRQKCDWRAWLALIWVVWFGLLYGRTVIERRGPKVRAVFARWTTPGR